MTRLVKALALALVAGAAASNAALAQTSCVGGETVTSHYAEQVCNRGPSGGYAVCQWVDRVQETRVPGACATSIERTEIRRPMSYHRRADRY